VALPADRPIESHSAAARYQPLAVVAGAVATGMVVDRLVELPAVALWLTAFGCLAAWLAAHCFGRDRVAHLVLGCALAATAASWHCLRWRAFDKAEIARFTESESRPVCVRAVALARPQRLAAPPADPMRVIPATDRSRLVVRCVAIRDGRQWREAQGRFTLLVDGHLLGVAAGDQVQVFGQLARTSLAHNPGQFDFAEFQRGDRQLAVVRSSFPECVRVERAGSAWGPARRLDGVRSAGRRLLDAALTPQAASLAAALLLGERAAVDYEHRDAYLATGTIHLLVVSGLHVGILAGFLLLLTRLGWISRRHALGLVAAAVWLYAAVAGGQPPVIRAAVLVSVFCFGALIGRRAASFNALALAGLVVLAINPADLFRTGPQLSFLAVATLIHVANFYNRTRDRDPLDRLIRRTRPWPQRVVAGLTRGYLRVTWASLAIWLVALPLVTARFHLFSPAAIVLSPLLTLPLTVALAAGFALFGAAWMCPPAVLPLGNFCDVSLQLVSRAVTWAEQTPGSYLWVAGPPEWWLIGFYGLLVAWSIFPHRRPPRRWCLAIVLAWSAVGFGASLVEDRRSADQMRLTFVSVGHGCGVIVELPGGQTLLYDAGRLGSPEGPARSIAGALWERGIDRLDAVVLSHADADHYNALPHLLRRFAVETVLVSPVMFEDVDQSPALARLAEEIEQAGVPLQTVWHGNRLAVGQEVAIEVLHPPKTGVLGSDNTNSIVLALEYLGRRVLLPGDLEGAGMQDVMAELPFDADLLLAPHHGSPRSDPPGFADWCTPEFLVISGGSRREVDSVVETYRRRGVHVLHTAEVGAVTAVIREAEIRVWSFHPAAPNAAAAGSP